MNIITPKTLNWWMQYGETFVLINVNSYLECMDTRIPRSICLPCDEPNIKNHLPEKKNTKVVIYDGAINVKTKCPLTEKLLELGYNQIYILQGGLPAWKWAGYETESVERIPRAFVPSLPATECEEWLKANKNAIILDIRPTSSFEVKHIEKAVNIPLSLLHKRYQDIPLGRPLLVVDEDGTKSLLAASYLVRKGFREISRLNGGMLAWERSKKRK
ncbi:MAG: rhodanese-like domain-containing protein [Syntrophales bacterium]|nr:rhodanese-like domain-containing protein [Syntrophales bacterium]